MHVVTFWAKHVLVSPGVLPLQGSSSSKQMVIVIICRVATLRRGMQVFKTTAKLHFSKTCKIHTHSLCLPSGPGRNLIDPTKKTFIFVGVVHLTFLVFENIQCKTNGFICFFMFTGALMPARAYSLFPNLRLGF